MSTVALSLVRQPDNWRVKIAWPNSTSRYFGKFHSREEAEKWIAEHNWLTTQSQEPEAGSAQEA